MLKALVVLEIADTKLRQVKDQVRARLGKLNACATQSDWSDMPAEIPSHRTQAPFPLLDRHVTSAYNLSLSRTFCQLLNATLAPTTRRSRREHDVHIGREWMNTISNDIGAFPFSSSRLYADSITGSA